MTQFTPQQTCAFENYVRTAPDSSEDLKFLLENLGFDEVLDWSELSLRSLEEKYWQIRQRGGVPQELGGFDVLEHLIGQYLGESIVRTIGGNWIQARDTNRFYAEPCIDGFGNAPWDKIYPNAVARSLATIMKDQPHFPGAKSRAVLAEVYKKAMKAKSAASTGR